LGFYPRYVSERIAIVTYVRPRYRSLSNRPVIIAYWTRYWHRAHRDLPGMMSQQTFTTRE